PWVETGAPEVGQRVVYCSDHKLAGTVKFVGATHFSEGEWVGIALDKPLGKNDGTVQGKQYFECLQNHGLFMRAKVLLPEAFALEGAQETHPETADSRLGRRRPRAERGDDVPKTIPRLRRGVQSAASQERLSIEVPEQQVFRTARRPPDELQRELRIAVEERDMENLRRLLPAAAQNGVAEAEVASARHIFDFEVQAALFEQLALIHSSLQELTGNPTAPHGATFEPPLHEKIAATVTSAVKSATADLLAELRAVRSQLTTGPSEEGRREKVETDGVGQSEESGVALAQFWEVGGVPVTNSEREQLQSSEDCQHTQREVAREVEGFNCQSSVEDPQVTAREVPMEPVEP
ncbi:Dynactin subunit 1 (150 kDa dynein-associated polypeptide) (DAP-150) (DP-150) (p135) (p150-glued), partial [Durusdinium trenchii]